MGPIALEAMSRARHNVRTVASSYDFRSSGLPVSCFPVVVSSSYSFTHSLISLSLSLSLSLSIYLFSLGFFIVLFSIWGNGCLLTCYDRLVIFIISRNDFKRSNKISLSSIVQFNWWVLIKSNRNEWQCWCQLLGICSSVRWWDVSELAEVDGIDCGIIW